jgi:hypothetical protein
VPTRSTGSEKFTLSGDGLRIRRGSDDAVSEDYTSPGTFTRHHRSVVAVTVEEAHRVPLANPVNTAARHCHGHA